MNKMDVTGKGEAKLAYHDGEYEVLSPGAYVVCAVSGARVPLEALRYWSVDLQEAYAGPGQALARMKERGLTPR